MRALIVVALLMGLANAAVEDDLRDGDRHFEDGDWQKAAAAFDRAIGKSPGQVPAAAYGKRAAIFIILHSYQPGLEFIAKAKLRHPGAPEILEQEALILWEVDRKADAIVVAEQVVVTRPQSFTNQKLIGEYFAARDPVKTTTAYEAYLATRPPNLETGDVLPRLRLGFAYIANARTAIADGPTTEPRARELFGKAAGQFEIVIRKHGKQANAQPNADNGLCAAYTGLERFDEAVTVCERITADPKRVDAAGSAWFNLATAYAKRKNVKQARAAAGEFVKLRKTESRGYRLLGDVAYDTRDWQVALDNYSRAEKLVKADQLREKVLISIGLGKTYRRLPTPNVALAIEKLSAAYTANPTTTELAIELGGAYLDAKQDAKVIGLTDALLGGTTTTTPAIRAGLLVLAGKARFNQREFDKARQRFEAAQQLLPTDIAIRRALVLVLDEQALEEDKKGDKTDKTGKAARALVDQALAIDPASPVALTNAAVLAIAHGDCDGARPYLSRLEAVRGHDAIVRLRLLARSYTCGRADPKRAIEAHAAAEKLVRRSGNLVLAAELDTEWAPLLFETDLEEAIKKLESALRAASTDPEIAPAAKRNLAIALYHRGWKRLRDGKAIDAVNDFERSVRDPSLLRGTEQSAFELSHALALVDAGRASDAVKQFKTLTVRGNQATYLRPPFAKIPQLFEAYAGYRSGTLAARQQAAAELAKLEADAQGFTDKLHELLTATWESIAYDQWRTGQPTLARRSLANAEKYATGEAKRRLAMDKLVFTLGKNDARALEAMGSVPAEALVNLGIVYELLGRPKDAYETWQRARGRVQTTRDLQRWIDAKKRIYGL